MNPLERGLILGALPEPPKFFTMLGQSHSPPQAFQCCLRSAVPSGLSPLVATGERAQMRGFATDVGAKADIGARAGDPTLVYGDTPQVE